MCHQTELQKDNMFRDVIPNRGVSCLCVTVSLVKFTPLVEPEVKEAAQMHRNVVIVPASHCLLFGQDKLLIVYLKVL